MSIGGGIIPHRWSVYVCGAGEGKGLKTHLKFLFIMLVTKGWVSHLFNALEVLGLNFPGLFLPLYLL